VLQGSFWPSFRRAQAASIRLPANLRSACCLGDIGERLVDGDAFPRRELAAGRHDFLFVYDALALIAKHNQQ